MKPSKSFLTLLEIDREKHKRIAVVGGGGKTSLIFRLARELVSHGQRVIVTTTTHMAWEPERPFARDGEIRETEQKLMAFGYVVAAALDEEKQKLVPLPKEQMDRLFGLCDVVLTEADGSRGLPLKVPEDWEPVIPDWAQLVIAVAGLDCLGKPIGETAHRAERTAAFLKKERTAPVTEGDVVKITASDRGLCKGVNDRDYRVYLNKEDLLADDAPAERIVRELRSRNVIAAYGSLL